MDFTDFCDRWLAAWTGNQPTKLIEFYHQSVFYRDPANKDGISGQSNLLNYLTKLLAKNPDWVWRRKSLYPIEDGFVLKWEADMPYGDRVIHESGLDLVMMKDNLVISNEVFFDRSEWLK